jgi:hypothetical protein
MNFKRVIEDMKEKVIMRVFRLLLGRPDHGKDHTFLQEVYREGSPRGMRMFGVMTALRASGGYTKAGTLDTEKVISALRRSITRV